MQQFSFPDLLHPSSNLWVIEQEEFCSPVPDTEQEQLLEITQLVGLVFLRGRVRSKLRKKKTSQRCGSVTPEVTNFSTSQAPYHHDEESGAATTELIYDQRGTET